MSKSRRWRALGGALASALLGATVLAAQAPPAEAAPTVIHFAGNFFGDARAEVFQYRPGTGAEYIFADWSKTSGSVTYVPLSTGVITGTYVPVVGDYDGDGFDEIIWYAEGTTTDYLWDFDPAGGGTYTTSVLRAVNSPYQPVAGDFTGDGVDDVFWYGAGTVADYIWDFEGGAFDFTIHVLEVSGDYVPLAGAFSGDGAEDIVWYGPGATSDYKWDFSPGATPSYTSSIYGVTTLDTYEPFTLDRWSDGWTDIFWYIPGGGTDPYHNWSSSGMTTDAYSIGSPYDTAAGDLLGDGYDDVLWWSDSAVYLWDWHTPGQPHTIWYLSGTSAAIADAAEANGSSLDGATVTVTATAS